MHSSTKILFKILFSLASVIMVSLLVTYTTDFFSRFIYVLVTNLAFMLIQLVFFEEPDNTRSEQARRLFSRVVNVLIKSLLIAAYVVGGLLLVAGQETQFITIEGNMLMINMAYLMIYAILWLVTIVLTNTFVPQ